MDLPQAAVHVVRVCIPCTGLPADSFALKPGDNPLVRFKPVPAKGRDSFARISFREQHVKDISSFLSENGVHVFHDLEHVVDALY